MSRNHGSEQNLVSLSHAVPLGSERFGRVESVVGRGSGGVGYAEYGMSFGTVPSMTVYLLDILLSGAETFSERRVLETGHGWKGRMATGRGSEGG